ncbi:replication protein A 32 kDa subunit-like [Aethina tumida]|uniref:replication protein A 32 kDa subunit-like n=1 Tax=Aethina tumida TaxID=116153 RepID=UPI002148E164|nr:replication protein A 32 kDa subunit-like [Aethina tumida]
MVVGRVYGIEKTLTILNANVTTDSNDITTHLLDVIRVKFEAEAKSKEVPPLENNPCVPLAHSMSLVVGEYDREYEQPMLTKMQTNICNILKDFEATPIGISYEQLLRQFQPHQHYEIKRALQFLINEGYAYSTIDNCHFKLTCVM